MKSVKQFAHTACGILPCEQKKAENLTKAEQKQQTKSRAANYLTVEDSPTGRADRTHLTPKFVHISKLNTSRCSAVGSAPVSGTGGLEFESPHFDQKRKESPCGSLLFFAGVDDENYILAKQEGVRIPSEAVGSSLTKGE